MPHEYRAICEQAMGWVRRAGAIARERIGAVEVYHKADRSPVTDADHAVQNALLAEIARAFPDDAVITEETQHDPDRHASVASAGRCWVIDPIDGTRNYARAIPLFSVSVALMVGGTPVIGLVYDPMLERMYRAVVGEGAWQGDERLSAASRPLSGSTFLSIPTSGDEALPAIAHRWIDRMVVRNLGSTALHLVLLAAGAIDGVYCRRARLWDIAAGALIVTEAGAVLRSLDGRPHFPMDVRSYRNAEMPFIAGGSPLVDTLLAEYRQAEAGA